MQSLNLLTFLKNYYLKKGQLHSHKYPVVVRTGPNFSSNPNNENFSKYCKFQLIKFKPWVDLISNLWDNEDDTDDLFNIGKIFSQLILHRK